MSKVNAKHDRTYEAVDVSSLESAGQTSTHTIYLCPFCEIKTGKPDNVGKLYFSEQKALGVCFRCNTVVFPTDEKYYATDLVLKRSISKALAALSNTGGHIEDPPKVSMSFGGLSREDILYLKNRNPLIVPLLPVLGLMSWEGSRRGIVAPFIYKSYIGKFQVRYQDKLKPKYYTMPGDKLLYSPQHLLNDFKLRRESTVTICEGVYDAIALWILGYPNPVAVLGSSVTEYQSLLLRKMMPENVIFAMDEWDISASMRAVIRSQVPSIINTHIVTFKGLDPEEFLVQEIKDKSKLMEYASNVAEIVKEYSSAR